MNWPLICESETADPFDASQYCTIAIDQERSAIDDYYEYVESIVLIGDADAIEANEILGRLMLLGLVSGVEQYVRSMVAGLLKVCPACRECAADQSISFGVVDYYGSDDIESGVLEGKSLASAKEIQSKTKALLGLDLTQDESLVAALSEFDKLCHLRHATVHARGVLGQGNARAIGLEAMEQRRSIVLSFVGFQQAALTCHNVVRAYNRYAFRKTVERWIALDRFEKSWVEDREMYSDLYRLCHSVRDLTGPSNAYQSYRSLLPVIP